MENNSFFGPYAEYWKRYADFDGKTNKRDYWMVVLVNLLISVAISVIASIGALRIVATTIDSLYAIAAFIPGLAITTRRLHDTGRSGLNLFWLLLPIAGWIVILVYVCGDSVEEGTVEAPVSVKTQQPNHDQSAQTQNNAETATENKAKAATSAENSAETINPTDNNQ